MAYIRAHTTALRSNGKPLKTYQVVWREQATDTNGLPVPHKQRARQETYGTRAAAEARRDELNNAKHTTGTSALADQRKAGAQTFAHYAQGWIAAQQAKVAEGTLKVSTYERYEATLRRDVLPRFGGKAIGAITLADCEQYRADLAGRLARSTMGNVWRVYRQVMRYAYRHNAIPANPAEAVDLGERYGVGDADARADAGHSHRVLTGPQVAAVAARVGEMSAPAYELLVLFLAYTGLRQGEAQGIELRDVTLTTGPLGADGTLVTKGAVRLQRTKSRRHAEWVTGTLKSKKSRRTVPLPPWLATRMAAYLTTHPRADEPTAPLWPRRLPGGTRAKGQRSVARLDWSEPCNLNSLQSKVIRPALEAVGLPASRPATTEPDGTITPATKGFRLHDFRHTFAALQLTAGVHFLQVSKWLGHASYVLTLSVYADYIPEEDAGNTLPEPIAPATPRAKVVPLRPAQGG